MAVVRKLHDPDAEALLFGHFCRNFSHLGMRPGQGSELDFLLSCLLSAAGKRKRQDGRDCCNHNTALHSGCLLFFSVYQSHKAPDLRNTLPGRSCGRDSPPPGLCCITLLNAFSFSKPAVLPCPIGSYGQRRSFLPAGIAASSYLVAGPFPIQMRCNAVMRPRSASEILEPASLSDAPTLSTRTMQSIALSRSGARLLHAIQLPLNAAISRSRETISASKTKASAWRTRHIRFFIRSY